MFGGRQLTASFLASKRVLGPLLIAVLLATGCGDSDPGPTVEELLESVEGRPLTSAEVSRKLGVGETLCQLHDEVLHAVWQRLSEDQLVFQDFVFAQLCPDRSVFYAGLTGRYVTEEAENSGIVASTTQVPDTTVTGSSGGQPPETLNPGTTSPELELTPTSVVDPDDATRGSIAPLEETPPTGQIGPTTVTSSADSGE